MGVILPILITQYSPPLILKGHDYPIDSACVAWGGTFGYCELKDHDFYQCNKCQYQHMAEPIA